MVVTATKMGCHCCSDAFDVGERLCLLNRIAGLRVAPHFGEITQMLIPQAYAQAAGQPPQGGGLFLPLMMVGILLFMYFTTIRPQRKRQKEHAAMVAALKKGDEVALSSGMLGKISGLDDNFLILSVGNNVELKFQKIHVTSVLPKGTLKSVGVESN